MRREGRKPVAARHRLESSDLLHTFPPGENDHMGCLCKRYRRNPLAWHLGPPPWIPAFAGMTFLLDSGLCLSQAVKISDVSDWF